MHACAGLGANHCLSRDRANRNSGSASSNRNNGSTDADCNTAANCAPHTNIGTADDGAHPSGHCHYGDANADPGTFNRHAAFEQFQFAERELAFRHIWNDGP